MNTLLLISSLLSFFMALIYCMKYAQTTTDGKYYVILLMSIICGISLNGYIVGLE